MTQAIQIGTGKYCGECGARIETPTVVKHAATPRPSMDMMSRVPTRPKAAGAPSSAGLHERAKPASAHVIDLRTNRPNKPTAPKPNPSQMVAEVKVDASEIQPHHEPPKPAAAKPKTGAPSGHHLSRFEDRFARAKQVQRSEHIDRFAKSNTSAAAITPAAPAPKIAPMAHPAPEPASIAQLPNNVATHHEAMANLIGHWSRQNDTHSHVSAAPKSYRGPVIATAAIVVIMGGYIWLQNYPKFSIQAAAKKVGISASLPGYLPSSYSLSKTNTQPGILTLDFSSPNQQQPLTISQRATAWDSNSLLDNYVAQQSNDYTAVQGQGLTVYLFDQNNASWVNHGVWYTIEGTARLSREQILKIAYSL